MNAQTKITKDSAEEAPVEGLALLRAPFQPHQISRKPKPTKQQTEDVKADYKKGFRCPECGSWHHKDVVHLDYVGHAALTDRLLDTDLEWNWEPMAVTPEGLPAFDKNGGLWIKLTICGVTRIGYGSADGKSGGDAIKEIIGDALRNSGMRFGAALDLWHKGDLHAPDGDDEENAPKGASAAELAIRGLTGCTTTDEFKQTWAKNHISWKNVLNADDYARVQRAKDDMVKKFQRQMEAAKPEPQSIEQVDPFDDEIPF